MFSGEIKLINWSVRNRLLTSSVLGGLALTMFSAARVNAADASDAAAAPEVTELVVTGSRIPTPNLTSVAPVTSVGSEELRLTGATRVEDLLNQLPQVVAEQGGFLSNASTGTATVSLRDLGSKRTLVLIDGQRLLPGDPVVPVPDVNFIPAALIDRIEVDVTGASAVYGADAVAGVVNFIMKKNFEGVRIDANYGIFQNDNGNAGAQAAETAAGYPAPKGGVLDGQQEDVTIVFGANSPDGKGNFEGYVGYRHIDPVLQSTRDYSACTLAVNAAKNGFNCAGSSTDALGRFIVYGPNFSLPPGASSAPEYTLDRAHPGAFAPYTGAGLYNYGALNYYQRVDERYTGGFFARYEISPALQPYATFMFMDDHTRSQVAPSGSFGFTYSIPCSDPLLSANQLQAICGQYGLPTGPTSTAVNNSVVILRRNIEGGPRINDLVHDDYRVVIGMKGDLGKNWHYDVYAQYGESILDQIFINDISKNKLAQALDVVPGANGTAVCADPTGGCIPYNIFTPGGVTAAQAAFLSEPGLSNGVTTEQVVSGSLTGDLAPYGVKSPLADNGVGVAIGAEYRRETLVDTFDSEFLSGDLAGQGGPKVDENGAYAVREVFGEARIPLVEGAPFIKSLNAELGYRYSNYTTSGGTSAYKLSGDWAINDSVRIRGGFNRTVRAPNILELFAPQAIGNDGTVDNCAGSKPVFTQAQCANTGVSAAQYGHIASDPAGQYFGLTGGNPSLKPETGDTYSLGIVFTPRTLLPGFTMSADYFNTKISNVIEGYGGDNILNSCALTGEAAFCNLVHRAASTGSLWLGTTVIGAPTSGYVIDITQNAGFIKTSGVDFAAGYRFKFSDFGAGDWGGFAIDFLGTYTHDYQVFSGIPGSGTLNCVGDYGVICQGTSTPQSGPLPNFKSKTRFTWTMPWTDLLVSVAWRYIGPVSLDTPTTDCAVCRIPAYNYFDLAAEWKFKHRYTFRMGINNIFDRDPPIVGSGDPLPQCPGIVCSGNTFPQVYDPLGRYLFVGLTADF